MPAHRRRRAGRRSCTRKPVECTPQKSVAAAGRGRNAQVGAPLIMNCGEPVRHVRRSAQCGDDVPVGDILSLPAGCFLPSVEYPLGCGPACQNRRVTAQTSEIDTGRSHPGAIPVDQTSERIVDPHGVSLPQVTMHEHGPLSRYGCAGHAFLGLDEYGRGAKLMPPCRETRVGNVHRPSPKGKFGCRVRRDSMQSCRGTTKRPHSIRRRSPRDPAVSGQGGDQHRYRPELLTSKVGRDQPRGWQSMPLSQQQRRDLGGEPVPGRSVVHLADPQDGRADSPGTLETNQPRTRPRP